MKRFLLIVLCTHYLYLATAQQYIPQDSIKVVQLLNAASVLPDSTNWMLYFARKLKGIPYVAKTLEHNKNEQLVINLRQLDCTTYVENVLAFSMCRKSKRYDFSDFCRFLQNIRYEHGEISYTKRLHYFTAWMENNTIMGFMQPEPQAPNPPFTATQTIDLHYMTTHPHLYPMLHHNGERTEAIRQMEEKYTGRQYAYIPKDKIENTENLRKIIHDGDIIAILTNKPGLDTSHIGIAVWHKNGLHLLNASQIRKCVVEESQTLRYYMSKRSSQIGIRIIRMAAQQ